MSAAEASEASYVLGSHAIERERLERQHAIWRDAMLSSWDRAGFGPGQRLLDLGCGPGFASCELAERVGPAGQVLAMMRAVKEHVEKNFEHVGPRFADEARKIHYGETDKRSIYGQATREQAAELADEGIEFGEFPDLPNLDG